MWIVKKIDDSHKMNTYVMKMHSHCSEFLHSEPMHIFARRSRRFWIIVRRFFSQCRIKGDSENWRSLSQGDNGRERTKKSEDRNAILTMRKKLVFPLGRLFKMHNESCAGDIFFIFHLTYCSFVEVRSENEHRWKNPALMTTRLPDLSTGNDFNSFIEMTFVDL